MFVDNKIAKVATEAERRMLTESAVNSFTGIK